MSAPRSAAQGTGLAALAGVFGFALGLEIAVAALAAPRTPGGWSSLAVFFDGHKYLEIARSFPLPYAPEGRQLLGHAPGYPAAIALVHALAPRATASAASSRISSRASAASTRASRAGSTSRRSAARNARDEVDGPALGA